MVRPRHIPGLVALAGCIAGAVLAPTAESAAPAKKPPAKRGTFSGRLSGALPRGGRGDASVRVFSVQTAGLVKVAKVSSSGRFSVTLPAGAYVLDAIAVRDRAVMSERLVPVSLRAGQHRRGARIALHAVHAKAATKPPAPEHATGKAPAAGTTTYRFDDLAGSTAALATLGRGLPALVADDVTGNESCTATQLADTRARTTLARNSSLKRSAYFARSTKISRALLAPQLAVTGSVTNGADRAHARFEIAIVDLATGKAVDTLKGAVRRSGRGLFTDERRLAAALSERICRRPKRYKVTLTIDARGEYTAYNSTAHLASTASAKPSTPPPYSTWGGSASTAWTNNVFRSRVTGCPATKITPGTVGWSAVVTALGGGLARVDLDLSASEYLGYSKADFTCGDSLASITGAPGPLLTGTAPRTFTLPATGGTGTINSTVTLPTGGFIQQGTVTLTPAWGHGLPGA